jgi:hypothetical protein
MSNYDYRNWEKDCAKKSAHELLMIAQDLLYTGVGGSYRSSVLLPSLESALRKAVIREASVGVMENRGGLATIKFNVWERKCLAEDRSYDLIPKEADNGNQH